MFYSSVSEQKIFNFLILIFSSNDVHLLCNNIGTIQLGGCHVTDGGSGIEIASVFGQ